MWWKGKVKGKERSKEETIFTTLKQHGAPGGYRNRYRSQAGRGFVTLLRVRWKLGTPAREGNKCVPLMSAGELEPLTGLLEPGAGRRARTLYRDAGARSGEETGAEGHVSWSAAAFMSWLFQTQRHSTVSSLNSPSFLFDYFIVSPVWVHHLKHFCLLYWTWLY